MVFSNAKTFTFGFTLVEMLVVLFIISLFSSISFVSFRQGGKDFILERASQKLAQDIRKVQEMAMSTKECCGGIVPKGYGIRLVKNDNFYLLYADIDGNQEYNSGDTLIETIYFEKGVIIKNLDFSPLSINYQPPEPKIKISGNLNETSIIIALEENLTKTKTIKVNKAGLISVE